MIKYTDEYAVHFTISETWVKYIVYPISLFGIDTEEQKVMYSSSEDEQDYIEFEEGKCYVKMKGSLCWRGVWEDRYYMVDEEYWYGELKALSDLYLEVIEPTAKEMIRAAVDYEITE